jgi:hypothetical protein
MYKTFNMRNKITCRINGNYSTAATLYTLETWSVSGTSIGKALHREIIKFNSMGIY